MTEQEIREMHLEIDRLLKSNDAWQEMYDELQEENLRLTLELAKLRVQRDDGADGKLN
ncbi:MAG TPA: hypothetical protein ACFYD4_10040 [Candidatus Wunengus sp. YC61]|uniref:hypothetical protein n=1 Tax=Candidatus Wunengus sp. YC61 TaxID=3367698 RepID=UPI00402691D0